MRTLKEITMLKYQITIGDRVRCIRMYDNRAIESGTCGTVEEIDDMGTIHVKWDNGRTLGLIPEVDIFEKI